MAAQVGSFVYQTPQTADKHSLHGDLVDKIDHERGNLNEDVRPAQSSQSTYHLVALILMLLLGFALLVQCYWPTNFVYHCSRGWQSNTAVGLDDFCPQVEAFTAPEHQALLESLDEEFGSVEFKLKAYESLGGAVRIPTENYDDMGPPLEDPRWENMAKFHGYLESRFPKVHSNLKRTTVNTYSLVYEWKGTQNVKPLLLTAHMDVVPVSPDTYDDWVHPPYSGFYDGEWIWGRGSSDDKAPLTAIFTAIETLLERGFAPSRTVLLALGSDEESGGRRGGLEISKYLSETYGPNSMAMLVDEGEGFSIFNEMIFATPSVSEKGYMDIRIEVFAPGGHSSTPPKHTAIGILAKLITELEAHPHEPQLIRGGTYYQSLGCRAKYDTGFPEVLTKLLLQSQISDKKLEKLGHDLIDFDPLYYAFSGTTQAVDIVEGGVKVNALPEAAWAVVNHRIADHSSLAELMSRFINTTIPTATKHNMTLEAFGEIVGEQGPSWGTIRFDVFNNFSLSPAPVTPTIGSGPFALLSGTIRSTFETRLRTDISAKSAIVSPWPSTANTDTRHYWSLTPHIFRYHHRGDRDIFNGKIHSINEALRAECFLEQIRFFTRLILNADQSDLLE